MQKETSKMIYKSYEEYVEATLKHYKNKPVDANLMVISKKDFDKFNGVIEFGAGSKDLVNKYRGCDCAECKCKGNQNG